jgi:hypothetical protein
MGKQMIKSKLQNPIGALRNKVANVKQGMIDKERNNIHQQYNQKNDKAEFINGTSYDRMQLRNKLANQMLNKKSHFKDNEINIISAARSLRIGKNKLNKSDEKND